MPHTFLKRSSMIFALTLLLSFPLFYHQAAHADDADKQLPQQKLPEIIVTADPLQSSQENFSSSVSILPESSYAGNGNEHFQDIINEIPNLNFAGGSNRPRFFQIRGIGELEQYEGAPNHSVGFFIDDFDFSGLGSVAKLFDTEQIEVLRGPQGMAFGANALGGIVHLKTSDPTPYTTGRGEFTVGSDNLIGGGIALGGPVDGTNEKIQFRVSAYQDQEDGFRHNVFLHKNDTNGRDEFTGRAKLRILPSDDVSIDLSYLRADINDGYDAFAIDNSLTTQSDRPGKDDQGSNAGSAKVSVKLPSETMFSSISSLTNSAIDYSFDGDWGNNPFWGSNAPYDYFSRTFRRHQVASQEFRLFSDDANYTIGENYKWLAGTFGQRLTETSTIENDQNGTPYDTLLSDYGSSTYAGFGQLEIPLVSKTSLTSGLRIENRKSTYDDSRESHFNPSDTMLGGNISLNHEFAPHTEGYGLVSRGYRAGGFNPGTAVPEDRRVFNPEYLWNFETGVKAAVPEWHLKTNSSLFYSLRREQQVKLALQQDPSDPLAFTYLTDNAARGRNLGAEFESSLKATERLSLIGSLSLLSTKFISLDSADQSLDGREQSHAPSWQYSIGPKYKFTENIFAQMNVTGRDSFYFDDSNDQKSKAYSLVNLVVGYETKNWTWTVWAHNLFDKKYSVRGFYFGDEPPDFPNKLYVQQGDPVQVGTTLSYNF